MIMDVPPAPPALVIVEAARDRSPLIMLGFMAVGSEGSMSALEAAAGKAGFRAGRTSNDRGEAEVMVVFAPGSSPSGAWSLYRAAQEGRFGPLRLEVTIVPVALAADGIDLDTEVTVEDPAHIAGPRQ